MRLLNRLRALLPGMSKRDWRLLINENFEGLPVRIKGDRRNIFVEQHPNGEVTILFKDTTEEELVGENEPGQTCNDMTTTIGPREVVIDWKCIVDSSDPPCLIPMVTYATYSQTFAFDPTANPCQTLTETLVSQRVVFDEDCKVQACVHPSSSSGEELTTSDRWVRCDADSSSSGGALELFIPTDVYDNAIAGGMSDPVIIQVGDTCCYRLVEQDVSNPVEDLISVNVYDGGCASSQCEDCGPAPASCAAAGTLTSCYKITSNLTGLWSDAGCIGGGNAAWDKTFYCTSDTTCDSCNWNGLQSSAGTAAPTRSVSVEGVDVASLALGWFGSPDRWRITFLSNDCTAGSTLRYTKTKGSTPEGTYTLAAGESDWGSDLNTITVTEC